MALPTFLLLSFATLTLGQRPFFAGIRPIGYPEVTTEALGDRFGVIDGTTQRLPVEAHGDRDLVDRLSKLPIDQQPFWLINWQALEAHRQKPQTYPQKPNPFVDPIQTKGGSNSGNLNSNIGSAASSQSDSGFGTSNRFGVEEHPNNQDPIENAYTNSNSGTANSNSGDILSDKKVSPSKDKLHYSNLY